MVQHSLLEDEPRFGLARKADADIKPATGVLIFDAYGNIRYM